MSIAHKTLRPDVVPATYLAWLKSLRARHEVLAVRLAVEVLVPRRLRQEHEAEVATWHERVRVAARDEGDPPSWSTELTAAWLAGRVDRAEAAIAATVRELLDVLGEADAMSSDGSGRLRYEGLPVSLAEDGTPRVHVSAGAMTFATLKSSGLDLQYERMLHGSRGADGCALMPEGMTL